MSFSAQLKEIRRERDRLSNQRTAAAVALYERAIKLCDAHNALDEGWEERAGLMHAVYYTGDWDKLLIHFGWCLAQHDRDPERFSAGELYWEYKWVVERGSHMPQIARDRLEGLLADMDRRFAAAGSTGRAVHQQRAIIMARLGEPEAAREAVAQWQRTGRDWLSDCRACEADHHAAVLAILGDRDGALERALKVIDGSTQCSEVPHQTHARVLVPLWQSGRRDAALHHHRLGYSMAREQSKLIEAHGIHLAFAAMAGLDDEIVPLIERHLPGALASPTAWERMIFLTATGFAVAQLAERGRTALAVRLPEGVARDLAAQGPRGEEGDDSVPLDAFIAWLDERARATAEAFDRRNGNAFVTRWLAGSVEYWR